MKMLFQMEVQGDFSEEAKSNLFTGILLKPLTYGKLVEVFAAMDDAV